MESPIIKKIILFGILTGAISLVLACIGFGIVEFYKIKNESTRRLISQMEILAFNLKPTLLFDDKDAASEILRSLQSDPTIIRVTLYKMDGEKLAAFVQAEGRGNVRLQKDIYNEQDKVGWLVMESVYPGLLERYAAYVFVCLIIILISIPCLYVLSAPLRRQVSQAVVQLIDTTEALKRSNQDLEEFAYVTSHDLKAPLRGIASLAEWLANDYKDKLDPAGQEQLNLLVKRVRRMHHLIDAILQYSKIGRTKEEKAPADFNKLVKDVVDSLSIPSAITVRIDSGMPTLTVPVTQTEQVFQNLLSNAVKYADKSKGDIAIGCTENGRYWQFSVSDNGPGIEEKYFEKIFKIFQTLSSSDDPESTGVGLAIVKKIVERNGGKVWIASTVGVGTTFFFTLPKTSEA